MRSTYKIVHKIASTSGLAYSLERGADIGLESNDVWDGIVKVRSLFLYKLVSADDDLTVTVITQNTKGVGQFKNKGWPHYEKMKQLVPSMSKGTYRFTAQEAPPTCPPAASGTPQPPSVLSPLPTTYQIHWQAQSGVAAVARPDIEMRPFQLPVVPANRLGSEPSQFIPPGPPSFPSPSSSVFRPPSVPSSHIGSAVSSIQPSSSVSVRFDHDSNKRKADDDVSMVSVTSGPVSVVSATGSGASTGSRKRRAPARSAAGNSDLSLSLRDGITTLQSSLHANQSLMDRMEIRSASRSLPAATAALGTSELTTTTDAEERKNVAKQLLIENDQDFLTMEQMLVIFDVFGEKRDYVNEYILLATLPASPPELRRGWLSKRLANLCRESHCAGSGD